MWANTDRLGTLYKLHPDQLMCVCVRVGVHVDPVLCVVAWPGCCSCFPLVSPDILTSRIMAAALDEPLLDPLDETRQSQFWLDEHDAPLKLAIVGAGIGGLTAAIGLRRNGHDVDVCAHVLKSYGCD